jgi:hypothetical protein
MLHGRAGGSPAERFEPLAEDALATRKRDAGVQVAVRLSKAQARWLREVERASGGAVDSGTLVRALIDLAGQLDVEWAGVRSGAGLRAAVRDAVLVRRAAPGP